MIDRWSFSATIRSLVESLRPRPARALPHLFDVHPVQPTAGRWIGLRAVLTECIRGSASIRASRGVDFRPLPGHEPADWRSRWARLKAAADRQVILPPVELLRVGDEYWVIDGHNRVALARARGQLWIDADVTELNLDPKREAA